MQFPVVHPRRFLPLLAVFAGMLFGLDSNEVRGSCGDYLQQAHDEHDIMPKAGDEPVEHRSCDGPACRSAPSAPLSSIPPRLTVERDDLIACRSLRMDSSETLLGLCFPEEAVAFRLVSRGRLDRPPRV